MREDDLRLEPMYTARWAARYIDKPEATLRYWAYGREQIRPVVTAYPSEARDEPTIPFVGLTEAMVVLAFQQAGLTMQRIRRAIDRVEDAHGGLEHAITHKSLYVSGQDILFRHDPDEEFTELFTGNRVFKPAVRNYLKLITYDFEGWAERIILPVTPYPVISVRATEAFGQPILIRGGAPIQAIVDRIRAHEPIRSVAKDFDARPRDVEAVIQAYLRWSNIAA